MKFSLLPLGAAGVTCAGAARNMNIVVITMHVIDMHKSAPAAPV
jgi:hypothetical protein